MAIFGRSGGGGTSGSGTTNTIAKFTAATVIGDSNLTDDGTTVISSKKVAITPAADSLSTLVVNDTTGTQRVSLGTLGPGLQTYGAMWLGSDVPSATNYVVAKTFGSDTILNATTGKNILLVINDATGVKVDSSGNFVTTGDNAHDLGASGATRFRTAYFGTSVVAPTATLSALASDAATTNNTVCVQAATGVLLKGSGALGVCLGTSSERYKEQINPLSEGLQAVMALSPVSYFYKQGYGNDGAKVLYGLTAEGVVDILPDLVGLDDQGRPNSVDLVGLLPVLVNAIQQQQEEIQMLKDALETTNERLEHAN